MDKFARYQELHAEVGRLVQAIEQAEAHCGPEEIIDATYALMVFNDEHSQELNALRTEFGFKDCGNSLIP